MRQVALGPLYSLLTETSPNVIGQTMTIENYNVVSVGARVHQPRVRSVCGHVLEGVTAYNETSKLVTQPYTLVTQTYHVINTYQKINHTEFKDLKVNV